MKWILAVFFLAFNVMAESVLSELPADVQNEIRKTETTTVAVQETKAQDSKDKESVATEAAATTATPTKSVDKMTAKENEIPLSLETQKKISASENGYFRVIMVVALLGVLASGMWIFVRKAKTQNIKRNKNEIKVLAQHYLGPKKSLAVVRVAGESILVGITDAQINMIKTLSLMDDELPEVTSQNFKSELDERLTEDTVTVQKSANTYNRKSQINTKAAVTDDEMDEFSIKGIKDLVSSKLKNMRSI